jgi:hypothetical protein
MNLVSKLAGSQPRPVESVLVEAPCELAGVDTSWPGLALLLHVASQLLLGAGSGREEGDGVGSSPPPPRECRPRPPSCCSGAGAVAASSQGSSQHPTPSLSSSLGSEGSVSGLARFRQGRRLVFLSRHSSSPSWLGRDIHPRAGNIWLVSETRSVSLR